jgi:hypothetical protein
VKLWVAEGVRVCVAVRVGDWLKLGVLVGVIVGLFVGVVKQAKPVISASKSG